MKNPNEMTAGEINREMDQLDKQREKANEALIADGRGYETAEETRQKSDPLALRWIAISDRQKDLRAEMAKRYGPGCPSRLPRGFGPIKNRT